jgi:hypothetical protein
MSLSRCKSRLTSLPILSDDDIPDRSILYSCVSVAGESEVKTGFGFIILTTSSCPEATKLFITRIGTLPLGGDWYCFIILSSPEVVSEEVT